MEKIFGEILSMSVDSAWLIIAVIICRAFLQKSPKYFSKILWGLVGLRLVMPFSFKSVLSLIPDETQQTTNNVVEQVVSAPVEKGVSFSDIAPILWVAVGVAFLVYGIISYIKLRLKIIDGVLIAKNIYQSEKIQSPFVCGFIKPKIYLPYGLDETTQECVLQHEKTHIKYADHIIKAISFVILCVHWFNPLVWVAYFMLCKDIELSCDENVVKNFDSEGCKQYAKALLELGVNKVKFTACPVAFGEVSIKTRIKSVIGYKKAGKVLVALSLCLCTVVAVCFMTEPEVKAKESNIKPAEVVVEEKNEPLTEKVTVHTTESTTETTTEHSTETITEVIAQQVNNYEEPVDETEELYDDSMFETEDDGIEDDPLNRVNVMQPDVVDVPSPTSIYDGVSYNNFGSNSSVIGNKTELPTLPSINWDPAVTQAPTQNYGNTNHPHFEGNRWVY